MKMFLSWSGKNSLKVANALKDWLPTVLQAVKPWLSEEDINKGTRWAFDLRAQLEITDACIVCLTPDSLASEWINFEAGSAAKASDKAFVYPYLFGLKKSDLSGPLSQFQATNADKNDTFRLIRSLNFHLGSSALEEKILEKTFSRFWPDLESHLNAINLKGTSLRKPRSQSQILTEVLERVRRIEEKDYLQNLVNEEAEDTLSKRELEVLQYIVSGKTTIEIGEILNISVKSIQTYRKRVLQKLGFTNDVQLVRYMVGAKNEK